ncbi:MAG: ACP S-malonyltransferase [Pseudomonadota bacterium]|nr:ACP S-malonyltransferase [Pseudomonadota bacterium]
MSAPNLMFIFPGQGSQYVTMGTDLCDDYSIAREIYAKANEILGFDIQSISSNGPEEELSQTRYTQPALLTHQIACLEIFRELTDNAVNADIAGGHSLGEYSALVASGMISFEDGLRLVKRRGELMGLHGEGGMLALGLNVDEAEKLANQFYCQIASCNLPSQTVVGGVEEDLNELEAALPELYPKKRASKLKTEGAFHTYLMVAAAREFRLELDAYEFSEGNFNVLSNYTGKMHDLDPESIRKQLFFQLFNPVQWVQCVQKAVELGVNQVIEFGGGIGKGEIPIDKKPNLQSIMTKNLRSLGHKADYYPAINSETLRTTAEIFLSEKKKN